MINFFKIFKPPAVNVVEPVSIVDRLEWKNNDLWGGDNKVGSIRSIGHGTWAYALVEHPTRFARNESEATGKLWIAAIELLEAQS